LQRMQGKKRRTQRGSCADPTDRCTRRESRRDAAQQHKGQQGRRGVCRHICPVKPRRVQRAARERQTIRPAREHSQTRPDRVSQRDIQLLIRSRPECSESCPSQVGQMRVGVHVDVVVPEWKKRKPQSRQENSQRDPGGQQPPSTHRRPLHDALHCSLLAQILS